MEPPCDLAVILGQLRARSEKPSDRLTIAHERQLLEIGGKLLLKRSYIAQDLAQCVSNEHWTLRDKVQSIFGIRLLLLEISYECLHQRNAAALTWSGNPIGNPSKISLH